MGSLKNGLRKARGSLVQRILGKQFVYDYVRPAVVGGIDLGVTYRELGVRASDVVLDIGCGTGAILKQLGDFAAYVGVDTDGVALAHARRRAKKLALSDKTRFIEGIVDAALLEAVRPHVALLAGLLHHLPDEDSEALLRALSAQRGLRRVVTLDITLVPGKVFNNLLSVLDRGQYCRSPREYSALARLAGFNVEGKLIPAAPSNPRVLYWHMRLDKNMRANEAAGEQRA